MGVIEKFGIPKPISKILNWARAYDMWYFQFGLACCAIEVWQQVDQDTIL